MLERMATLLDENGEPTTVTIDGPTTTLRYHESTLGGGRWELVRDGEVVRQGLTASPDQTTPIQPVTPEPRIDVELVRPRCGPILIPAHELHHREREHGGCVGTCANHERLLDAIRDHRASRKPSEWTAADRCLYGFLPEVTW